MSYYSEHDIAKHVEPAVFDRYFLAKQRIAEQRIAENLNHAMERRIKEEAARIAALSQEEQRLREARNHIIDRILTLACPRCGQAFAESLDGEMGFSGCFALTCSRARCGCAFCAYCLEDCGHDAHEHVRGACQFGRELFGCQQQFERAQRQRRQEMLHQYLDATFGDNEMMRAQIVVECATELRDLNMEPEVFL